jgi:thioredoxin-dependent adenylylsulfate APS reductase
VDIEELRANVEGRSARRIVEIALERFSPEIVIAFSGSDDVLLVELAHQSKRPYRVMTLDTGRLHGETHRFFAEVERHYGIHIEYCFPRAEAVETLVRKKGPFSFYRDGHAECCGIRKVEPLRRHLAGQKAWITGQRRDQSPTRADVPLVELDEQSADPPLVKFNPLARMSGSEVWDAIRAFGVPHNSLHARGMTSIGCEPCTRALLPYEHERAGRWWWESETKKECGIHGDRSAVVDEEKKA